MKVVIALNTAWNLVNFRAGLIRALVRNGYEVVAVAPPDEYVPALKALGCRYLPLEMDNKGTHPGRDLMLLWRFYRLLRRERPDAYLGYTVKPNVYGSLAAHALGIPVVNNIAGLGAVFIKDSWLTRLVRGLYRLALARSARVFFQNRDDRELFIERQLVRPEVVDLLPGSGVDLMHFSCAPLPSKGHCFRFLLVARMLWDKGVGEYVEAARQLRKRWPHLEFCLLGFLDVKNPAAISRTQMDQWVAEGVIKYLGVSDDVRLEISSADCVVLPSFYREGVPRTLLEAAALGRPIITTDTVGCREVVEDGVNGYLCCSRDAESLAEKMERVLKLDADEIAEMGRRGREKAEREFDERIVIGKYVDVLKGLVPGA
ncbi:MAG: glycosyltransferase family 4 protein [Zoogloea sp.]|nr:glycosyltransferase family 4 protein [Zoogloea sp.]